MIPSVSNRVARIVFSPTERVVAVGYYDGKVRLWNSGTGSLLATFGSHSFDGSYGITSLAYRPDGQVLATGGSRVDRTIQLWDVATGKQLHVLTGSSGGLNSLSFSSDGQRLASVGDDGVLRLWHTGTGRQLLAIEAASSQLYSVAFSPDDRQIAASDGGRMWVWGEASRRLSVAYGEPIDLLPWLRRQFTDAPKDGNNGDDVHLASTSYREIPIPLGVIGSYTLRGSFTRTRAGTYRTVGLLLPTQGGRTMFCLDHSGLRVAGLDQIDRRGVGEQANPTAHRRLVTNGQVYDFEVIVSLLNSRATISVSLDGERIVEWNGAQDR